MITERMMDMATFEIKMIFKRSANMEDILKEINMICEKRNIQLLELTGNTIIVGTEDINYFGCAYISLSSSSIIKSSLLDAYWTDDEGTYSCRKELLAPVA